EQEQDRHPHGRLQDHVAAAAALHWCRTTFPGPLKPPTGHDPPAYRVSNQPDCTGAGLPMYSTGMRPLGSVGSKKVPSGFGTTRNWRNPSTCIGSAVLAASAPTTATVMIVLPLPVYEAYGGVSAATTSVSGR